MKEKMLAVGEAARKSGYTLNYIYNLLYSGRVKGAKKVGREWRIPVESVEALKRRKRRSR